MATRDVSEFLLEWCPRKLSVARADCLSIPASVATFGAFLEAEGLLRTGSSSRAALAQAAAAATDEFVAAMGDSSQFGLAKSLFGAAGAEGVDLSDPDRLQEWMAEFNARPEHERRKIIPDTALVSPPRPALPPVALPDEADVAASRAAAPILESFARFATFVGAGRRLTQTGNLTLADARALVGLLATGDIMDGRIGDRTFATRSAAELPRLRQLFAWARKAGVVRVAHGRVIATKAGLAMAGDPASSSTGPSTPYWPSARSPLSAIPTAGWAGPRWTSCWTVWSFTCSSAPTSPSAPYPSATWPASPLMQCWTHSSSAPSRTTTWPGGWATT